MAAWNYRGFCFLGSVTTHSAVNTASSGCPQGLPRSRLEMKNSDGCSLTTLQKAVLPLHQH